MFPNTRGLDSPITPFYGNDEFSALSPLRRVPVFIDGDLVLSDSTVICEYLDEAYSNLGPPLYPPGSDPKLRAQARFLEEFADTRMGDVIIWSFFNQRVIGRAVWGQKPDEERVKRAMEVEMPEIFGYLESVVPRQGGFLFGSQEPMVADISIASFFRNLSFARGDHLLDPQKYPSLSKFVARVLAHPALSSLVPYETVCMKVSPVKSREALKKIGCPITETTVGTDVPRQGYFKL